VDPSCNCNGEGYGFIITPRGNVLNVSFSRVNGLHWTFVYKPCGTCGSGCSCLAIEHAYDYGDVVMDYGTAVLREDQGEVFARELHAVRYESPDEWRKHFDDFYGIPLVEVKSKEKEI